MQPKPPSQPPPLPSTGSRARLVEALAWVLLYGGGLALALAWFLPTGALRASVATLGALGFALGVLLIVVRARMRGDT